MDGPPRRDLIIVDQGALVTTHLVSHQSADGYFGIGNAFLVPGGNWQSENFCKARRRLCLSHIGRNNDAVADILGFKIILENDPAAQRVCGYAEKPMDLG